MLQNYLELIHRVLNGQYSGEGVTGLDSPGVRIFSISPCEISASFVQDLKWANTIFVD
jgi:hypothetical protein